MSARAPAGRLAGMNVTPQAKPSAAFYIQSILSFAVSLSAVTIGVLSLPVGVWIRAFLSVGLLYVVTSTFTLAKCVRDHQEATSVHSRIDQARVEKILSEHDPYRMAGT
jgi:hypothetical protein